MTTEQKQAKTIDALVYEIEAAIEHVEREFPNVTEIEIREAIRIYLLKHWNKKSPYCKGFS